MSAAGDGGNRTTRWSAQCFVARLQSVSVQVDNEVNEEPYRNKDIAKKERRRERRRLLCELLLDFAKNTTLHGLRYVTERGLSVVEKMFWVVSFLLSLSLCMLLMYNVWVKWRTNQVIATFSERLTYVSEVPFPAVTICPQAKIDQQIYNYTKNYKELDDKFVRALCCYGRINESFVRDFSRTRLVCKDFSRYTNMIVSLLFNHSNDGYEAVQKIIEVAPKRDDIFFIARWHAPLQIWKSPISVFNQVLIEEGVCYTFNSLAADEILNTDRIQKDYTYLDANTSSKGWSSESGYPGSSHDTYPRRGQANSAGPAFSLALQELFVRDERCDGDQRGFKVYLHHPGDLPQSSMYYYTAVPGQDNSFAISVDLLKGSDSLFRCPVNSRQCYFSGERSLKYFRMYSQSNCRLECIANYTLAICRCLMFHMPHDDSTVLCSFLAIYYCVEPALEQYISEEGITNGNTSQCNCLPSCNSIQYQAEVFKSNTKYRHSENYTMIQMYFKKPVFVSKARECTGIFELTDFLAYCGGLLGLFLGFSFLSFVEIFYFCTLRLGCMYRKVYRADKKQNINHIKTI